MRTSSPNQLLSPTLGNIYQDEIYVAAAKLEASFKLRKLVEPPVSFEIF